MNSSHLKEVLSFAAFRPEPDNCEAPFQARFPKKRMLFLNINRGAVSWTAKDKNGRVIDIGHLPGDPAEVAAEMAPTWQFLTEDGWVCVSINNRFIVSLEQNLSRKPGWRDSIRTNPKIVLGSLYDRNKRYALHHNPETNSSLLLAVDDAGIKNLEQVLRSKNFKPARIACGLFGILTRALDQLKSDPAYADGETLVVGWCEGSICTLIRDDNAWSDLRCRSGLNPDDVDGPLTILKPYFERRVKPSRIVVVAEDRQTPFAENLTARFDTLNVTDLSRHGELWETLGRD